MSRHIAILVGLVFGLGVWFVIIGARKTPERITPPGRGAGGILHLLGMAPGGRLHSSRHLILIGAGAGLAIGLVTGWFSLIVIIPVVAVGLPSLLRPTTSSTEVEKLTDLTTWVRSLVGVLSGGAVGLEQAIRATLGSAPKLVRPSVARMVARLEAQQPIKTALRRWADELDDHSADLIAAALILESDNRHGAISPALTQLAAALNAQAKARRAIETERSSGRATVRWVTIITLVVLGFAGMSGYLAGYSSPLGQVVAVVLFSAYVGCLMWMRQISLGQPIPRFLPASGEET